MTRFIPVFCVFLCVLALFTGAVTPRTGFAQDKINVQAFAVDGATLQAQNALLQLWGIDPTTIKNTLSGLKARVKLDDLIDERPIMCSVVRRDRGVAIAQCMNADQIDLSLSLIESGLAIVNRADIVGSPFQKTYTNAEKRARLMHIGLWENFESSATPKQSEGDAAPATNSFGIKADYILIGGVVLGPIIGMLFVGWVLYAGLNKLIKLQKHQIATARKKEQDLREREKFILASSLDSEINTNRAKIDAFLLIYEDMLRTMRDPSKPPKYKRSGDIIHQRPSLSRAVYDANLDKLDLLGTQIVTDLSKAYANIDGNPDYITLEPETPIDQAMDKVQRIIQQANGMIEPLDKIGSALTMIIRDRKGRMPGPSSSPI